MAFNTTYDKIGKYMLESLFILEKKIWYFKWLYCLGQTPLLIAVYSGKIETVKFLVSKGSSLEEKDKYGNFFHNL